MPIATNTKINSINEEFYNNFLDKLKTADGYGYDNNFWETRLASEARMTFNLLPLSAYEEFVFKNLDAVTGLAKTKSVPKLRGKGSKGSLRKSLTGSGSIRSFGSRIKSLSLLDSTANSLSDHDFNSPNLYELQLKCLELISSGERIKSFSDNALESFWSSFESILQTGFTNGDTAKNILINVAEIRHNWLLKKILNNIESDNEVTAHILNHSSGIHLKVNQFNKY